MRKIYLLSLFIGISVVAFGQESSCNDGVDNDGDGFIDCFDGDCANHADCDDSYIGKDKLCQTPPPGTASFGMQLGAASRDRTTLSYGRMVVGDLDRDGTPEMVTTHHNDKKVFILNGDDLTIKTEINTIGNPEYFDHAIANLDNDNCAEIFIVESEVRRECDSRGRNCRNNTYYMVTSFDCNGVQLWRTQAYDQPFTIGLADFDHDGNVELYYKNEIMDAKTGAILVNGSGNWNTYDSGPVAVDLVADGDCTECTGLELVLGGEIFAVDLDPRVPGGGSVGTAIKKFNDLPGLGGIVYHPKYVTFGYVNSQTSIADYNLDGHLDVIMNGATSASATSTTTVFFWDVYNNQFKTYQPRQPNGSSWPHGTGRINLADIDGDGKMNATFVSGARIYALKEDFTLLWQKTIAEQTSGFTSTTVFDFNNDNAVEIVYRDESSLYIIDGKTGNAFTTITCRSRTANDYPIVVDVDADGATEICVSCATNDNVNIGNNGNTPFGQIRTYKSSLEPWVSARKVWNQYAYFNVNVNDDLTIPQVQQKHHLVFSEDVCGTGENRALNSFLNQSAILDSKGCKTYPSADVAFLANPSLLNIIPPTCPDQDFKVSFSLQNIGDLNLTGSFPITFYNGDPRLAGATKLNTEIIPFDNFKIGDQLTVPEMTVQGTGGAFVLFAVLNDDGSTVPTPISLPNSGFDECSFSNNIVSVSVNPQGFQVTTVSTDQVQCGTAPAAANGSVRAFKLEGSTEQTIGYTFYWFDGTTAGPSATADYTGPGQTAVPDGTYTVYAVHDAYQCGSDTVQAVVGLQTRTISATVNVENAFSNCKNPDGRLSVTPDGGQPIGNFRYEWFEGTVFGTSTVLSTSNVLVAAKALTYSVLITEKSSACQTIESGTVPDETITPVVTTTTIPAICSPPNSGAAAAHVNGVTAGYTFYWYNGLTEKPAEDFRGKEYTGLLAGNYTVVARDNSSGCLSEETVAIVENPAAITVQADITAVQTSCATPNGAASASVNGTTSGFTFKWFRGANTLPANEVGASPAIAGLAAGDYTVEALQTATGCTDTMLIAITDDIKIPTLALVVNAHQTSCAIPDGALRATASGSPGPYTYYWFNGNVSTPDTTAADFKGAAYTQLAAGFYTVVAADNHSRCGSARGLVEVLDQTIDPVVSTATVNQTSCNPGTPNGQASADVGGVTAGYTFRWFTGSDTTSFITESPGISNRAMGTYTVKAVNATTGCFSTQQVTIINNLVTPVVSAAVDQNVTLCNASNGQVSANVAGGTSGYDFYWFNGNPAAPDTTSANFKGSVYASRPVGSFTVVAVSQATRCLSAKRTVNVADNTIPPAITTATVNQTSCNTLTPNGQASADVGGVTAGYKFRWFSGADTTTFITEAAMVTNRVAGPYTVKAVDLSTGCFSTRQVSIVNNLVTPVVSAAVDQNLTLCNASNGQVSANVAGGTSGYDFYWFNGNPAAPDTTSANFKGPVYASRPVGSFTVVAVSQATRCLSAKRTVNVVDNTIPPAITTATINQTSCNTLTPNGQASADVGGVTAGYKFRWFSGADTTTFITEAAMVTNRVAGTYTVKAVDLSTGCFSTRQVSIVNNLVTPVVSAAVDQHLTLCNASNGQVSANVAGVTSGYDFYWFNGNPAAPDTTLANFKGPVYASRPVGSFTVVAVSQATRCLSAKRTVNVADNTIPPAITTATVNQTSCNTLTPNGQASADVGGVTAGYKFRWFSGADTTTFITEAAMVTNRVAGTYTVKAVDLGTGCFSTRQVSIVNNLVTPVVSAAVDQHLTLCNASNGQVSANVAGVTSGYDFYWFNGNPAAPDTTSANFKGPVYASRPVGSFTVVAVSQATRCLSAKRTVNVVDNTVPPVVVASSPTDNTACLPANSNGAISANVGGVTTDHTFHIFRGQNTNPSNEVPGSPSATISTLAAGVYTVQAIDNITGCAGKTEVTVINNIVLPTLNATSVNVTDCSPANGSVTATVSTGVVADYTFTWFNGDGIKAVTDYPGETTASLTGLTAGTYTLTAFNDVLGCDVQRPFTLDIVYDPATDITIIEEPLDLIPGAICNDGTGQLGAHATSPVNTSGFTFSWWAGDKNSSMVLAGSGTTVTPTHNRMSGISSGRYTVIALDNDTGCQDSLEIDLPYVGEAVLVSIITAPQTDCAVPNGSFEAEITPGPTAIGLGATQASYRLDVFQNGVLIQSVPGVEPAPTIVSGLSAGNYTVLAVETQVPPLTGCASTPNNITIGDATVHPAIISADLDNKNCSGAATANGSITLDIDAGADPNDYSFDWRKGQLITGAALPVANVPVPENAAINIGGGFYTVEVINTLTGCETVETFHINDDPFVVSILVGDLDLTHQTDCSPVNGLAEVLDVQMDGASAGLPGFTFEWFENDGTTVIPSSGTAPLIGTQLGFENYFVKVTNILSNCESPLKQFEILDQTTPPIIASTLITDNSNCTGSTPNGLLTIDVNGGDPLANFTIAWFEGTGTATSLGTNFGAVSGANGETAQDLPAGTYTVSVTDNTSPGNSCVATSTFTISDDLPVISIDNPAIAITHQTDCSPVNGSATVTDILVNGVATGSVAGFTFEWLQNDGVTAIAGSTNGATVGVPLGAGDYFVRTTNTTSSCVSPITSFTIDDIHVDPVIGLTTTVNNSNCPGSTSNGSLTIDVNGGDPLANFTIAWFEGTGTATSLGTNFGAVSGANGETAQDLPAGTYTVSVTDNTSPGNSCVATSTFTISDDLPVISIDNPAIAITHQTDCSPVNGSAMVTDILVNGAASGSVAGFTFEWLQNDGVTAIAGSTNGAAVGVPLGAGDYFVRTTNTTSSCVSPITPFTIDDIHVDPVIGLTTTVNNSNCPGSTSNGSLTIDVNGGDPLANFTIAWFEGTGTATSLGTNFGAVSGANGETAQDLPAGTYTVSVTDNTSPGNSCVATSTFTISDDLPVIGIDNPDIAITHQTDCSPVNGSAAITDILVNGVASGSVAGFTFEWLERDGITVVAGSGNGATIGVALGAGDYFVRATRSASSCNSPITSFTVNDIHVDPVVTLDAIVRNSNCTGSTPNGLLTIEVNGGVDPIGDFTITWFEGTGTTVTLGTTVGTTSGVNSETAQGLPAGTYTVRVTDNATPGNNCVATATFTIANDLPFISIERADMAITHQTDCAPVNGTATVTEISVDGTGVGNSAGYIFEWLQSDGVTPVVGAGSGATVSAALIPGNYFVRATNGLSNCKSPVTPFTLLDQTPLPNAVINLIRPNMACDNNFTGELSVSVTTGTTTGYDFDWFSGKNNTSPSDLISSGITLAGLREGDYTVRVTDHSAPGLGCVTTATLPVRFEQTQISSDIQAVVQTSCAPALDGSLTVNAVTETVGGVTTTYSMSNPADRDRFDFQWFDKNGLAHASTPAPVNAAHTLTNVAAGTYYVQVTNALGCTSQQTGGFIDDLTAPPVITLENFLNPTVCLLPETAGFIQVSADNNLNFSDYTFEWFVGANASGTQVELNNPTLDDVRFDSPLEYTVRVTHIATHCASMETYAFGVDTVAIHVVASAVPLTSCVTDNGSLFATTQAGAASLFDYAWYAGTTASGTPVFTTKEVLVAPTGIYTVVATNPDHDFCTSVPYTTEVADGRVLPEVVATQKNPLTYCDPANPNGVAFASVNHQVSGFTFQWFAGSVGGTPLYTGSEISGVTAMTYFVRATDVVSGCANTASIVIEKNPVHVPEPSVVILSHHTNCVDNDGALSASVNGDTYNYTLQWYNGSATKSQPDQSGEFYRNLAAGSYVTTAKNNASGCISNPVVTKILPFQENPEFDVATVPTNCEQNIGEASVIPLNDVEIASIEWDINGEWQFGSMLSGLPKGEFTVTVTSTNKCVASKSFKIIPEVLVFNGVSSNHDGQNDIFEIACIGDFPANNVKIFNRAGTLVFEAKGYNNQDVFFDGVSNRGLSLLGTDLPEGTYFYIIDKGNGSAPRSGYLELLKK